MEIYGQITEEFATWARVAFSSTASLRGLGARSNRSKSPAPSKKSIKPPSSASSWYLKGFLTSFTKSLISSDFLHALWLRLGES